MSFCSAFVSAFPRSSLRPPKSTLFPYTTLFRSGEGRDPADQQARHDHHPGADHPGRVGDPAAVLVVGDQRHQHQSGARRRRHRSEEHTSELQSLRHLVCRLLLEKKKKKKNTKKQKLKHTTDNTATKIKQSLKHNVINQTTTLRLYNKRRQIYTTDITHTREIEQR